MIDAAVAERPPLKRTTPEEFVALAKEGREEVRAFIDARDRAVEKMLELDRTLTNCPNVKLDHLLGRMADWLRGDLLGEDGVCLDANSIMENAEDMVAVAEFVAERSRVHAEQAA